MAVVSHVQVPHLAFPFQFGPGNAEAEVVEQDTIEEIAQCVRVIVSTRAGEREELPDFGIDDLVFGVDFDIEDVVTEVLEWEPRASVLISQERDEVLDEFVHTLRIRVQEAQGG